ncbi:MAG: 50S ribosomal protein L32 [Planctomycetes bacterium]|nr:50S ribosomal protein L32 [Planctomycetota bacterium]
MAVPKRRKSKAAKLSRRTHDALTAAGTSTCSRCNQAKQPHRVCSNCGFYGDTKKIEVKGA